MRVCAILWGIVLFVSSQTSLAAVTVSPTNVSWASVALGNKGGQKVVTLTNGNASPLTLSSITFTGANAGDFSVFSKTCGSTLAAGASCTVNILFGPTATGTRTATLNFNDSDGSSPQTVAVTGLGVGVSASPISLSFASTAVGSTSAALSTTLKNGLSTAITLSSVTITGTNAADFAISANTCGSTLAAAASCSASVAFKPTGAGVRSATLSFIDSASNSPQSVSLSGTGTATTSTASVSPASLTFASTTVATSSAPQTVTLTNGGASITFSSVAIGGANSSDFSISSTNCGSGLAASGSCSATVVFKPTAAGARTATLAFTDTATNSPQTVALTGTGATASSTASVSPASLTFASTTVATSSASQTVTLTNGAGASITLSSVAIGGANSSDFSVSSTTCGSSLAASGGCSATVVFKPTAAGARTATLAFADTATNSPQTVALTGTGTTGGNTTVSPVSVSWASVTIGNKGGQKVVTLTNANASPIAISSLTFTGANPGDFSIFSKTCGASLAASSSCTVNLLFGPTALGTRTAILNFNDSDGNSPQTVALSGLGSGVVAASPTSLSFAGTTVGVSSAAQSVTLTNGLATAITIGSVGIGGVNPTDFAVGSTICGGSLPAYGTCTATIVFQPTAAGSRAATLSFSDSAANSPQNVALSGVGNAAILTISPTNANLNEGDSLQFTANLSATWSASCGSVSSSGLYVAPLVATSCMVTATPTAGGAAASASVTAASPITITPLTASTPQNSTQLFTASVPVTWASSCGSISSSGLFTASGPTGTCTITATAATGPAYTATATDTIINQTVLQVTPANPALTEGQTQQFSSGAPATWSASCGSITDSGLYTALLAEGSCTITATATDGSGSTASTLATVTSPITVTPVTVSLHALNTQSFSASQPVSWSTSCGTVSDDGLFTAPASAGNCTLTATASSGTAFTTAATITVDMVNQVRWRNTPSGTGLQSHEFALTPANVNSNSFGQAWSFAVDGGVWAQPLYMNALTINGAPHNVLFVGTDHDTMYALDADTGVQLWSTSLIPDGGTAVAGTMVDDPYIPYIGILGTPAIDNGTLYVVAETAEQNGTYFPHRLHALDIATGQEKLGGPVLVSDPNLPPAHKLQRPGLTIANGSVYVSMGSLADKVPYKGLIFQFDNSTLAQQNVWISTPTGTGGGIWMGGGSPSVDSSGNLYVLTGNGTADGVTNFGESAVKLSPTLQRLSFFTPYNAAALTAADLDLGAASVPVMPDVNGQFPHELIFCGKSPDLYVINRDTMGGFNSSANNVIQELSNTVGGTATTRAAGTPCYTSPSAWGNNIYFIANGDVVKQFTLDPGTGLLSTSPVHQGSFGYQWPGSQSMISSNGSTNGIIWSFDQAGKKLRADNASDVSSNLFVSPAIGTGYVKWVTPTVINGHVYVGGQGAVVAFSLK